MKRTLAAALVCAAMGAAPGIPPRKPKLILAIVVDQFRYDYLQRFRADYTTGFKRLLEQGAVFEDAHHIHYPTVTAVGHSTFLSGATPNLSGIVANEWFDRETGKNVTSVSDPTTKLLGATSAAEGSSPRRLLVSTVGDEIKMSGQQSKVVGVSIKDRAAILPAGHMADGAYWFDNKSEHWVTSSYYKDALPDWVEKINAGNPAAKSEHGVWYPLNSKPAAGNAYCSMDGADGIKKCASLDASPWGNEIIEDFAEHALTAEKLGSHTGTDLLAVSFSANDYVGHAVGPDDPEVHDISVRTDRLLGKLLDYVDKSVGLANVVVVLTADHGVVPVPEVNTARHMIGGRNSEADLLKAMNEALAARYGAGKWIIGGTGTNAYVNTQLVESKKLDLAEVELTAANAARKTPHVFRVITSEQLLTNQVLDDAVTTAVRNGFFRTRSGDVLVIPEAFYIYGGASGTTHGTPFNYDSHVPVIFMGFGIKPGHYYQRIAVNDIAPTLCAIAGVQEPSGSVGRVLQEMWQ